MPDVFDTLDQPKTDVFDEIAPPKGDVFDQLPEPTETEKAAASLADTKALVESSRVARGAVPTIGPQSFADRLGRFLAPRIPSIPETLTGKPGATAGITDIAGTFLKFATPPPQIAEPIRKATDPLIAEIHGEVPRGIVKGAREMALGFPVIPGANAEQVAKAVLAIFTEEQIRNLPERARAFVEASKRGDKQQMAELGTQEVLTDLGLGLAHARERGILPLSNKTLDRMDAIARQGMTPSSLSTEQKAELLEKSPQRPEIAPQAPQPEPYPVTESTLNRLEQEAKSSETVPTAETSLPIGKETEPTPSTAEAPTTEKTATEGEIIGMGGAVQSEFPADPGNPDIYGVAARVRAERAKAGQVEDIPAGKGISAPDSVEQGRALLQADPTAADKAITTFEADPNKAVSANGMASVRARGEQLAYEARRTEEKFGTDSPEYRAAWKSLSDWDTRSKAMQTEWHKTGMAQQGETDIDTGTFTGLQRAFKDATDKDFTPQQAGTAKKIARKVKTATDTADLANVELLNHFKQKDERTNAEKQAIYAANKVVRDWAARRAELENLKRVADAKRDADVAKIRADADAKAKASADKAVHDAASLAAKKEIKERLAQAQREKEAANIRLKEEQKAVDAANKVVRDAARRAAEKERREGVERADVTDFAWRKVREYIDAGMDDFNDIRNKVATDMGLPVAKVTAALARDKRAKFLANEVWKKQQTARLLRSQAKRWLTQTEIPLYVRALQNIPSALFGLKVGFHGTVALGTHAPFVAFQPRFWTNYVRDFGKMYRMVGSKAYYEQQVQDLIRRPNYIRARRAGLVNDTFTYEDFNSPDTSKYFGNLSGMGNRGYTILKILRQDMFDQMWNKLPRTAQVADVAEAMADGLNHATGVVKGSAPQVANLVLFAPRLEASRVMWLAGDPLRAMKAGLDWKNASEGEKYFAINQVKEKAWVAGTLFGMLALNQGFLSAAKSDQEINFTDPMKSDFLKFKVAGMSLSYGNAMLSMARLPARLYAIRESSGGKLRNLIYPDESTYSVLGEYARSQQSPFASLMSALWFKSDWQNRPLPSSDRPMPKRLRAQGVEPYTWPEFFSEQVLPIPFEEAVREVWKNGLGMSDEQIAKVRKMQSAISILGAIGEIWKENKAKLLEIGVTAGTGGRLVEDQSVK